MSPVLSRLLIQTRIAPWLARIDALSLRERAILLALALFTLWGATDALLFTPLNKARGGQQEILLQARTAEAEAAAVIAGEARRADPDAAARQRMEQARINLQQRLSEAARMQERLVAPKDMPRVLQGLLARQPGLRVTALKTLAPEAVGAAKAEDAALFRHGIVITVSGDYASLVRYMENLEKLPAGFYWEKAELDASAHPEIRLTLTLNTLGLERAWMAL